MEKHLRACFRGIMTCPAATVAVCHPKHPFIHTHTHTHTHTYIHTYTPYFRQAALDAQLKAFSAKSERTELDNLFIELNTQFPGKN